MIDMNHMNPCKSKVPFPILKMSVIQVQKNITKASCPQILKIRNNKSTTNILAMDAMHGRSPAKTARKRKAPQNQNQNICHNTIPNLEQKRSHHNILQQKQNHCIELESNNKNADMAEADQNMDKIMQQHLYLTNQLASREAKLIELEKQHSVWQQKYIRLLQVTNERSQSQIKILLEEGQSRLNKSKMKNSVLSEQAQKLKVKLEGLDISSIKPEKQNSFKLSQMMI